MKQAQGDDQVSLNELQKQLSKKAFFPLYLFYGTEDYLMEEATRRVIDAALAEDEIDFNLSVFDLGEITIEAAIDDAETIPFFGDYKVVLVKEPIFLTGQKDKTKIEHDLSRFQAYIENPPPHTIMILTAPYEKLDERKKLVKQIKKNGFVFQAKEMDDRTIKGWIEKRFAQNDVNISSEAIDRLVQLTGPKLLILANEIDKISLYAGTETEVNKEIVTKLVARSLEQNIFDLIDKVVKRKLSAALSIYYDLLEQKEEPIKILSLLTQQFRIVLLVKILLQKGYGQNQIASQLKIHPYRVKLAVETARDFQQEELQAMIDHLADADYIMKTGQMDKVLTLELFFVKSIKETSKVKKEA
jgi:DNA polymerase-3 subunit delta